MGTNLPRSTCMIPAGQAAAVEKAARQPYQGESSPEVLTKHVPQLELCLCPLPNLPKMWLESPGFEP